jgi:hypothetical protein
MAANTMHVPLIDRNEALYDHLEIRCPKLGGQVTFAYCRKEGGTDPCQRIIICWQCRFPVEGFLQSILEKEDWDRWSNQKPKEKMDTLLELIEAAKQRLQGGE